MLRTGRLTLEDLEDSWDRGYSLESIHCSERSSYVSISSVLVADVY